MTSVAQMTLAEFATVALARIGEQFPPETRLEQQVLCVAEEAGEFLASYRRWRGLARRPGSREEMEAELADVLITCYVTALLIDKDRIAEFTRRTASRSAVLPRTVAHGMAVRWLNDLAARAAVTFDVCIDYRQALVSDLVEVAAHTIRVADVLDIDLEAAWRTKAEKILNRPWREERS